MVFTAWTHAALPWEDVRDLNLTLVEGDVPGSNFCGVRYDGDLDELNRGLAGRGINLIIQGGVTGDRP